MRTLFISTLALTAALLAAATVSSNTPVSQTAQNPLTTVYDEDGGVTVYDRHGEIVMAENARTHTIVINGREYRTN